MPLIHSHPRVKHPVSDVGKNIDNYHDDRDKKQRAHYYRENVSIKNIQKSTEHKSDEGFYAFINKHLNLNSMLVAYTCVSGVSSGICILIKETVG